MAPLVNRPVFNSSAATVVMNTEQDNCEVVPMELDDTLPESLIMVRSDDLSTLNVQQSTAVADNLLSTIDWSSFDLELLGDPNIEPLKSDCCPEIPIEPMSNNTCYKGESVQREQVQQDLLEDFRDNLKVSIILKN